MPYWRRGDLVTLAHRKARKIERLAIAHEQVLSGSPDVLKFPHQSSRLPDFVLVTGHDESTTGRTEVRSSVYEFTLRAKRDSDRQGRTSPRRAAKPCFRSLWGKNVAGLSIWRHCHRRRFA